VNAPDPSIRLTIQNNERSTALVIQSQAAPIEVTCFGGPRIVAGDRVLWPSREFGQEGKSVELLLFLAASLPEGVDREPIGAALWPEVDLVDVASSLRQLRRRLRLVVARAVPGLPEDAPFERDSGRVIRLDPEVVGSDVHRFVETSRRARSSKGDEAIALFEQTRTLYTGDLFDSPAAPPFTWAIDPGADGTSVRQQYRQLLQENTRLLADLYVSRPGGVQTAQGIELYEELLRADPQEERISRALLRAHASRRDRTGFEREWRRLCEVLRSADPQAEPLLETSDLHTRLGRELQASTS
jgi:DNA-binding SARP family transcriptional activator